MKKRLIVFVTLLCMTCSLYGCRSNEVSQIEQATDQTSETPKEIDQSEKTEPEIQPTAEVESVTTLEKITSVEPLSDVTLTEDNKFSCSYDGIDMNQLIIDFIEAQ